MCVSQNNRPLVNDLGVDNTTNVGLLVAYGNVNFQKSDMTILNIA